jgi:hypothetical protein
MSFEIDLKRFGDRLTFDSYEGKLTMQMPVVRLPFAEMLALLEGAGVKHAVTYVDDMAEAIQHTSVGEYLAGMMERVG